MYFIYVVILLSSKYNCIMFFSVIYVNDYTASCKLYSFASFCFCFFFTTVLVGYFRCNLHYIIVHFCDHKRKWVKIKSITSDTHTHKRFLIFLFSFVSVKWFLFSWFIKKGSFANKESKAMNFSSFFWPEPSYTFHLCHVYLSIVNNLISTRQT